MEIRHLISFLQVAMLKSFTKAGDSLGYSQANVSLQIRQLESELGVPLFDRIGKTAHLTQYGEMLVPYAQNIVSTTTTIDNMFREKENNVPTPEAIIEETAKYYNFSAQELTGKSRVSPIVNARQIAMYLIKQLTNLSGPEIGKLFNRDNSTVLYSIDQVAEKIPRSKELSITIKDITANLNSN